MKNENEIYHGDILKLKAIGGVPRLEFFNFPYKEFQPILHIILIYFDPFHCLAKSNRSPTSMFKKISRWKWSQSYNSWKIHIQMPFPKLVFTMLKQIWPKDVLSFITIHFLKVFAFSINMTHGLGSKLLEVDSCMMVP